MLIGRIPFPYSSTASVVMLIERIAFPDFATASVGNAHWEDSIS